MEKTKRSSLAMWLTCPECEHKFSVPALWVVKYLERVFTSLSPKRPAAKEAAE